MNYLPTTTFGHIPGLDIQYSYVLYLFWFFICYLFLMLSHCNRECYLYYYIWHCLCYLHLRFSLLLQTVPFFSMFLEHWKIKYRLTCAILTPAHPHSVCQLLALWILPPYWQLSSFHFQPFLIALFLLNLVYCTFFFPDTIWKPASFNRKVYSTDIYYYNRYLLLLLLRYVFSFLCFLTAPFICSFIFLSFWKSGCNLWLQSNILKPILLNLINESLSTSYQEKINILV